ncbi:unnamed protein product [Linum tenue]|uniref:RFTS domain-containing protein n=1 Tax=Linum tenue TaxID=586396 RepID=A0AAV0HGR9_9ROSI|nr:unnamed protein product [Linum tenue]
MALSDEEGEILPDFITNYSFLDSDDKSVPFSVLPVLWSDHDDYDSLGLQVFMLGTCDGGQKVYKRAVAWKFELSDEIPTIYVLSKDRNWIILQKPKKSYEPIISSLLVTIHWLHFNNKNGDDYTWNRFVDSFRLVITNSSLCVYNVHKQMFMQL